MLLCDSISERSQYAAPKKRRDGLTRGQSFDSQVLARSEREHGALALLLSLRLRLSTGSGTAAPAAIRIVFGFALHEWNLRTAGRTYMTAAGRPDS